jgi:hypothetical protein
MKTRFLIGTALGLVCATAAFAQSPSSTTSPTTQQTQTPSTSSPATQKSPNAANTQSPSTSTSPGTSTSSPQAQTTAPSSPTGSSTSQPAQAQTNNPAPATGQATGQAEAPASGTANTAAQPSTPANNNNTAQTPSTNNTAQNPSTSNTAQSPSTNNTNNTAQSPSTNNTAQTPSTGNTAQSSSTNVNASVNINDKQRTRVAESITRLNVQPLNNVNFSLTVGTAVPRDVRLQTLPSEVVEVVPQYRDYSFFVARDEIVIVDPSSYQIVTVLPRHGGSTAAAPAPSRSKVSFTDSDREIVRKHVRARATERQTTGSTARVEIRRGERLPDTVEVEEFPETVYREAPSLRDYRYIHRENRTYLVDPGERRVIEEID